MPDRRFARPLGVSRGCQCKTQARVGALDGRPRKDQSVASWIKVGDQAAGNQLALAKGVNEQLRQGRLLFVRSRPMTDIHLD